MDIDLIVISSCFVMIVFGRMSISREHRKALCQLDFTDQMIESVNRDMPCISCPQTSNHHPFSLLPRQLPAIGVDNMPIASAGYREGDSRRHVKKVEPKA